MTDFVRRCAFCKSAIEPAHERVVDFSPTGRMVEFHSECDGKRGTEPPVSVGQNATVTRIKTTVKAKPKPDRITDTYGYDD